MYVETMHIVSKDDGDYHYMHDLMVSVDYVGRQVGIGQPLTKTGFCELNDDDVTRLINFLTTYMNAKGNDEPSES